uniref:Uncharacterized protein n=1 Tax=Accipiter nisus TaxID=211598 RepID=A0A8B9N2A3_9AVES
MDRVSSSMKQVSNPLPKVLSRRAGGGGLEAERESFERAQVRGGACPLHPWAPSCILSSEAPSGHDSLCQLEGTWCGSAVSGVGHPLGCYPQRPPVLLGDTWHGQGGSRDCPGGRLLGRGTNVLKNRGSVLLGSIQSAWMGPFCPSPVF